MSKRLVYLDNAATTPVREEVLEAMLPYLGKDAFGNPSSAHRFGRAARAGIEEAKRSIAEALGGGAEPSQVIFTSGGTEADNLAVIGCALAARDHGGPFRAAVSAIEHKAVLAAAHALTRLGGEEIVLPVNASGTVEEDALAEALTRGAAVVSVMWVNNEVGVIQPVARLAARCRAESVPGIVGLGRAVELAAAEQAEFAHRVAALRDELERRLLATVPDAVINAWQALRAPHVTNVAIPGTDSEALLMHFDLAGIACSSGSACSTGAVEPSHVLTAMGVPRELGVAALRFSFGKDNVIEDVEAVIAAVPKIVDKVRALSAVLHR